MDVEHNLAGGNELDRDDKGIQLTGEARGVADRAMLRGGREQSKKNHENNIVELGA